MIELFLLGSQRERFAGGVVISCDEEPVQIENPKRKPLITVDHCPYKPAGRYVCDHAITEAHLFDNLDEAHEFAKAWNRDCNIGWLTKHYHGGGQFEYPREYEVKLQISKKVQIFDHRKNFKPK